MNYKLLTVFINILLILWLILFYIKYTQKIQNIKESFTSNIDVLNYQMNQLDDNYTSIDELQSDIDTTTRKLSILGKDTNELNRLAYIFKYVTVISISLLILMICIFILDFDDMKRSASLLQRNIKNIYQRAANFKIKKV